MTDGGGPRDRFVGVVLAAGAGRRFGGAKQLAELHGRPLLQHAVDAASASRGLDRVVVVVGAHASDVRDALDAGRAELVECERWDAGLSASLRCGVAAAGDADWVVILLGDEPGMPPAAISRVLDAAAGAPAQVGAVRARWDGRPGHPVALRGALAARAEHLRGDVGARALLDAAVVLEVDCTDLGLPDDVDTPEDLEAMQR